MATLDRENLRNLAERIGRRGGAWERLSSIVEPTAALLIGLPITVIADWYDRSQRVAQDLDRFVLFRA